MIPGSRYDYLAFNGFDVFLLNEMRRIDGIENGNKDKILRPFNDVKKDVLRNPVMFTKNIGIRMDDRMKFYHLLYDYENDENSILVEIDEATIGFDRYDVEKGILSLKLSDNICVYYDDVNGEMVTDYVANDLIWFIVSEKYKCVIQSIEDKNIQFHPLVAKSRNSDAKHRFFLVNICNIIDGLDLATSKYSVYETDDGEKMRSIKKYAIRLDAVKEYNLFRLKDDYVSIFISEKMKKAIKKAGITGCDFLEVKVV